MAPLSVALNTSPDVVVTSWAAAAENPPRKTSFDDHALHHELQVG
jgi:hypothetical protein